MLSFYLVLLKYHGVQGCYVVGKKNKLLYLCCTENDLAALKIL